MSGSSRRQRGHQEDHVNHEAWAIPYGDLITLLLAFFVVMYSISSINEGKYRVLSDAMMKAFNSPARTIHPIQLGRTRQRGDDSDQKVNIIKPQTIEQSIGGSARAIRHDAIFPPPIPLRAGVPIVASPDGSGTAAAQAQIQAVAERIREALAPLIAADMVTVRELPAGVEVEINTDILFVSGSAEVEDRARPVLADLAAVLSGLPNPLRIEGHTDNVPIRTPRYASNWVLSAARAASVVELFAAEGLAPALMSVHGYGEYRPVADNTTAGGRNANRRVVVLVRTLPDIQGLPGGLAGRPGPTAG
ncbi:flagellar motor protein MotD [Salinisphaera sp. P385]|uniref:Flagellar motor protein MotD n=1 Tax=Spectribacter acetivorans TaxID=3075603 RepID=A0ABU3B738_9GAMM|nr:flagellar motor protein MotD [Salinisphaera sp. P385]MDT0618267.1 flagellar motor protein MotD [Salinisphaera sp. P385]